MQIELSSEAKEHLLYWKKSGNFKILKKIEHLIEDIIKDPFVGIGKPEALKYELINKWSRRITNEHRLIYEVKNDSLCIYSLKGHYT